MSGASASRRVQLAAWWSNVMEGTAGAPWVWWAASLVVIVLLLLGALKLMGLFPD